jgi:hypothetical protein
MDTDSKNQIVAGISLNTGTPSTNITDSSANPPGDTQVAYEVSGLRFTTTGVTAGNITITSTLTFSARSRYYY